MTRALWMSLAVLLSAISLAGWASPTPPAARAPAWRLETALPPVEVSGVVLRVEEIAAFAASAAKPHALRNPFSLAPSSARAEPEQVHQRAGRERAVPISNVAAADDAVAPALVGIAEQATSRGPARTAVFLTRDGGVEFAGAGDPVGDGRFRLSDVTADGAVLMNLKTGATARVVLQ